jgi:hypothetical protein
MLPGDDADICGELVPAAGELLIVDDPVEPEPAPGCIADEPDVVEPEPVAIGRSVPPDGGGGFCAKAGAATKAVAKRQPAICFISMVFS